MANRCNRCGFGTFHDRCVRCEINTATVERRLRRERAKTMAAMERAVRLIPTLGPKKEPK